MNYFLSFQGSGQRLIEYELTGADLICMNGGSRPLWSVSLLKSIYYFPEDLGYWAVGCKGCKNA